MSDKPLPLWEQLLTWLQVRVAIFANRFCGCEHLYWTNSQAWEVYMSEGESHWAEDDDDEYGAMCDECGHELTLVRPGKWQCNYCEERAAQQEGVQA